MTNIIQLNETAIKSQLDEQVRGTAEETLNQLLDKEADRQPPYDMSAPKQEKIHVRAITGASY